MTRPAPSGLAPRTRIGFALRAAAVLVAWFVADHRTDWTHVVPVVALPARTEITDRMLIFGERHLGWS
jgi:hypothetical protein